MTKAAVTAGILVIALGVIVVFMRGPYRSVNEPNYNSTSTTKSMSMSSLSGTVDQTTQVKKTSANGIVSQQKAQAQVIQRINGIVESESPAEAGTKNTKYVLSVSPDIAFYNARFGTMHKTIVMNDGSTTLRLIVGQEYVFTNSMYDPENNWYDFTSAGLVISGGGEQ